MTATVAYYLEGVVIHEGALVAGSVTGSHTWGEWAVRSWRRWPCLWRHSPPRWPTPAWRVGRNPLHQATDTRYHDDQVALPNRSYHQHGAVDADRLVCDSCRLSVRGIGIVRTGTKQRTRRRLSS